MPLAVRDKLAFIQDAFVRDVNGDAVAKPDDPEKVDMPALEARLLADARKVMGAGKVKLDHHRARSRSPLCIPPRRRRPTPPAAERSAAGAGRQKPATKSRCEDWIFRESAA